MSPKSDYFGCIQCMQILSRYQEGIEKESIWHLSKTFKCKMDDIVDAMCLAVTANLQM